MALTKPISDDHVPPRQLYVKELRTANNLNLLTIPVHRDCNSSFQHDEDYFVNTLAPFARGSYAGAALLRDVFEKYSRNEKRPLVHKVLEEFQRAPSGIMLPSGLVVKRMEGERVHRVAWKIVRGLYFHEFGEVLPERTPNVIEIVPPEQVPPTAFLEALGDAPSRGSYIGVFDYKYIQVASLDSFNYWGLLLWDRLIIIIGFHGTMCRCEHCCDVRERAANARPQNDHDSN